MSQSGATKLGRPISFVLVMMLLQAAPAAASTSVSGDKDTNAPLVIDPSSAPAGAVTSERDLGAVNGTVAFIQRMPVTKVIERVTLGDFASGAGCSQPASVRLFVHEHQTGDFDSSSQIAYSSAYLSLPSAPEKVSWSIPATTFRAGWGYSLVLGYNPSGCRYMRQTTWAHDAPQVNGGSARCTGGPPAQASGYPFEKRMWHGLNASDRQPACVSSSASWAFSPSMPEGWLMTQGNYVRAATVWDTPPTPTQACGSAGAAAGASVVYWRASPGYSGYNDYVCMWPQYAPLDATIEKGWNYGIPWTGGSAGAPRDLYVKLETINYTSLLQLHAPHLIFDRDDNYRADSPGIHANSPWTELYHSYGTATGPPWLDDLDATYHGTGEASESDFLDRSPHGTAAAREQYGYMLDNHQDFSNWTYGRVASDADGNTLLQYWLFYFHQEPVDFTDLTFWEHQGDWELVVVRLNSTTLQPDRAFYAQHDGGQTCDWGDVGHSVASYIPDVYVAQTTHASYFDTGQLGHPRLDTYPWDVADGDGDRIFPQVTEITSSDPSWVTWPGHWGGSADDPLGASAESPQGPKFQSSWGHELWAAGLDDPCD